MIDVDISNIWGAVALPDLLAIESEMAAAHERMMEEIRQWEAVSGEELERIRQAAEQIREDSEVCVVLGIHGSCLGARGAIELLQGLNHNLGKGKGNPCMFFAGNNLSTRSWNELLRLLKDKDFSVIVVLEAGTTLEPAIALRSLRWMLERKYGTEMASKRIYAVTAPVEGPLGQMVTEAGWTGFELPGRRFSVLTAGGLLPMAVAGIDISEVLQGAEEAREEYAFGSFENPLWQYAAVRNLLRRGGKAIELFASFEPGFRSFGAWWQQLFGTAEDSGLFPVTVEFPKDLYALGNRIPGGQGELLETMVRFGSPENSVHIDSAWKDLDGLGYLEGKNLDFVEEKAFDAAVFAHVDGGVPVIVMDWGELSDRKVGELFFCLEFCSGICGALQGANPGRKVGLEQYQRNLFQLLGKPEAEQ